jgi:hypothetical protein
MTPIDENTNARHMCKDLRTTPTVGGQNATRMRAEIDSSSPETLHDKMDVYSAMCKDLRTTT